MAEFHKHMAEPVEMADLAELVDLREMVGLLNISTGDYTEKTDLVPVGTMGQVWAEPFLFGPAPSRLSISPSSLLTMLMLSVTQRA